MSADDLLLPPTVLKRIDAICNLFEEAWIAGQRPNLEDYLTTQPELSESSLFRELLRVEVECRSQNGETLTSDSYKRRFPRHTKLIDEVFRQSTTQTMRASTSAATPTIDSTLSYSVRFDNGSIASPLREADRRQLTTTFAAGVLLDNRYLLERELGRGGMGLVFLAHDHRLTRPVAVKVILPPKAFQEEGRMAVQRELFTEEARLGANLSHPAIASVFDYGFHRGLPYTVFEYLSGDTLREMMRQHGPLSLDDVRLILGPLSQAMDFAHQLHVVHRDLKPENVRATQYGQYKILDLGLARRFDQNQPDWSFAGTPAYAAPEQADEQPSDGRADQYALAVIAYEMLTGQRPFQSGDLLELLTMHRDRPPESPKKWRPDLADSACDAVLRALAKDPNDRFDTCEDFAIALGCQMLSTSVPLPTVIMETNARVPRIPVSITWSRQLWSVRLLLVHDALWTLHRGRIECWPVKSFQTVSRWGLGRKLELSVRTRHGTSTKSWRFMSIRQCAAWHATLKNRIKATGAPVERAADPNRPPVLLLSRRPNVRMQVLGQVEATSSSRWTAEQSITLRSALIGADAVVDVQSERLYGPRRRQWRLVGKAVKSVDDRSFKEIAVRWSASAVSRAVSSILWFSVILLFLAILGSTTPVLGLLGAALGQGSPQIGLFVSASGGLLYNLCWPLLWCLSWPVLLCLALQWLKWPELNRPTVLAIWACAMAPILGKLGGVVLVGDRPREWYAMFIVVAEVVAHLLIAAWIIGVSGELREINRRSRELFERQTTTRTRAGVVLGATLLTTVYFVAVLVLMGRVSYDRVQDTAGRERNGFDLAIERGPLYDLTKRQWVRLLSSRVREDRIDALHRLAEFADRERREGGFGEEPNPNAVSAITECLSDTDASVRVAACKALMSYRKQTAEVTTQLQRCLEDPDPAVRSAASRTLNVLDAR